MRMSSLVERTLDGNSQAVAEFYQKFSPKILRFLSTKLPKDDAQELTNDVFLDAIDTLPMLRKHEKLLPWLYRIAHNKMVNFYRKKKIKAVILSQIPYLELVAKEINQPEFQWEKNNLRDRIETAFHSLSQNYRQILKLHYEDELPVKTIAVLFQLSPKATESLLYRARQNFIKAYERI